jgi:hypothetical protein
MDRYQEACQNRHERNDACPNTHSLRLAREEVLRHVLGLGLFCRSRFQPAITWVGGDFRYGQIGRLN